MWCSRRMSCGSSSFWRRRSGCKRSSSGWLGRRKRGRTCCACSRSMKKLCGKRESAMRRKKKRRKRSKRGSSTRNKLKNNYKKNNCTKNSSTKNSSKNSSSKNNTATILWLNLRNSSNRKQSTLLQQLPPPALPTATARRKTVNPLANPSSSGHLWRAKLATRTMPRQFQQRNRVSQKQESATTTSNQPASGRKTKKKLQGKGRRRKSRTFYTPSW
mmetsp:Transcript_29067/g.57062  ORF Transcript_29067/g.57062 Transcript_29067/m.57062 type:complete len:216 (-) Transcript_29067:596-1243(-)